MFINGGVVPLTIGAGQVAPYEPYDWTRPEQHKQWQAQSGQIAAQLLGQCAGDTHVFGCQHADTCKCGKAKRTVEPRVCPHCKKAHD